MNQVEAQEAAKLLNQARNAGAVIAALPEGLRPTQRIEGYQIQQALEALDERKVFGWKIAATSAAGQAHIGIDGPIAGRLFSDTVHQNGETLPFGANRMRVAEAEFAFQMGRTLCPQARPYEMAEVLSAIADLYLAIEIPDSRYENFVTAGGPQLIADNACADRFVLGPRAPELWREIDLVEHKTLGRVTGQSEFPGIGANVLGDPRLALLWLVNELSSLGIALEAGQYVTTGTTTVPMPIKPGDQVIADFGILGEVSCRFDEQ